MSAKYAPCAAESSTLAFPIRQGVGHMSRGETSRLFTGMYYKVEYGSYQENSGFREGFYSGLPRGNSREKLLKEDCPRDSSESGYIFCTCY